jgi:FkbM family methyltransferase
MFLLKNFAIFFFNVIDKLFHQKRIKLYLIKKKINIFFDVGSHLGNYTDLILSINHNCRFFMFEPQITIFNKIKKKYSKKKNIKIFNYAISNKNGDGELFINKHDLTSSFSKFNEKNRYLYYKSILFGVRLKNMIIKIEKVKKIKLEDFINKNKIKKIDLIKIDTEGHEFEVLTGIKNKINIIQNILIEFHLSNIYKKYNQNKIHKYLEKKGFQLKKRFKFPFTTWEDRIYSKIS